MKNKDLGGKKTARLIKSPRNRPSELATPRSRIVRLANVLPFEDYVGTIFDNHVDILGRTIFLNSVHVDADGNESGTDASMNDLCAKALTLLEQQNLKKAIKIVTANFGGELTYAFGIYDRIKLSPCRVVIHGYGPIMSAGSLIFQAGDVRLLAPNAVMMLHYAESSIESMRDVASSSMIKEHNRINKRLMEVYLERIAKAGKPANERALNQKIKGTLFLTATEAVAIGLADGIITKA